MLAEVLLRFVIVPLIPLMVDEATAPIVVPVTVVILADVPVSVVIVAEVNVALDRERLDTVKLVVLRLVIVALPNVNVVPERVAMLLLVPVSVVMVAEVAWN
jgi:hypothetical protein